jgi:hypothetical protein
MDRGATGEQGRYRPAQISRKLLQRVMVEDRFVGHGAGRAGAEKERTNGTTIFETTAGMQAVRGPYRRGAKLLSAHATADAAAGVAVYMDENSGQKRPEFEQVCAAVGRLIIAAADEAAALQLASTR